jgi:hypothetical protein
MYRDNKYDNFVKARCAGVFTDYQHGALIAHVVAAECPRWGVGDQEQTCFSIACYQNYDEYNGNDNREKMCTMHQYLLKSILFEKANVLNGIEDYVDEFEEVDTPIGEIECKRRDIVTEFAIWNEPGDDENVKSESEQYYRAKMRGGDLSVLLEEDLLLMLRNKKIVECGQTPKSKFIDAYMKINKLY